MAEDANRDDRRDVQGGDSAHNQSFTLSQLEKTEKPADFTMADLSAAEKSAQSAQTQSARSDRASGAQASQGRPSQSAGTARLRGRDASAGNAGNASGASAAGSASSATEGLSQFIQSQPAQSAQQSTQSTQGQSRSGRSSSHTSRTQSAQGPHIGQRRRVPRARRMKLSVTKISPWSVAKVTFMLSIAMGIIQTVCVAILYGIIDAAGVFDKITSLVSQTGLASNFNMSSILSLGQVLSAVIIFSVFEVVIMVLLSVILTFLYNVASSLVGGVHVTLGDD